MRRVINTAGFYGLFSLISGVFYREFTKFNNFEGVTVLKSIHSHLMVMGCFLFLIICLFIKNFNLNENKKFQKFNIIYNIGFILMITMFYVKGIVQILNLNLNKALSYSVSGISGVSHILLTIGLVYLFLSIKEEVLK